MPHQPDVHYLPPWPFRNGHFNTIYPSFFRKVDDLLFVRERINTPDNDFLDVDFLTGGHEKILVLLHGLEGSTQSSYLKGMAGKAFKNGYDVAALNMRGCSGEDNSILPTYHSGFTADLDFLLQQIFQQNKYAAVFIAGFSMGGNIALKYAGEKGENISPIIKAIATVSVPCDLEACAAELQKISNRLYLHRFLKSLKSKAIFKKKKFPEAAYTFEQIQKVKSFYDFDNMYTAPINGFESAEDYWKKNSSIHFISKIKIPVLILNALDDPFLPKECYPFESARKHPLILLETPRYGGHTGFCRSFDFSIAPWHEERVMDFFSELK
jgi:uncharacterized protein